ncbi:MAG: 50S ribosome-binding GTPase, partial [Candidatus Krumholzibacteria bacterium]|nr:50S ribosome-binding GTPase [Candidatus Krumholzibacteria bacterium]
MPTTRQKDATRSGLIALCGNPNCGKTTIFNAITGLNQQVGNYPGVTVDKVTGPFVVSKDNPSRYTLIDIPGSYSLSAFTPDEYIAASTLFGEVEGEPAPDAIICVIDATNLERGMYLLFQIMQIGCPVVVALNMVDIVERHGYSIDTDKLSKALGGIPVVPVVGSRGRGISQLKEETGRVMSRLAKAPGQGRLRFDKVTESALEEMVVSSNGCPRSRAQYLRVLFDVGGPAEQKYLEREGVEALEVVKRGRDSITKTFGLLSVAETMVLTSRASEINR